MRIYKGFRLCLPNTKLALGQAKEVGTIEKNVSNIRNDNTYIPDLRRKIENEEEKGVSLSDTKREIINRTGSGDPDKMAGQKGVYMQKQQKRKIKHQKGRMTKGRLEGVQKIVDEYFSIYYRPGDFATGIYRNGKRNKRGKAKNRPK